MSHYTNPHTFKQYSTFCIKKSIKMRLSYAFADFRNIAQRAKLCKTVQNVPNSFYNFKWKTRAFLWIFEIRCWKFLTNFIPKYYCVVCTGWKISFHLQIYVLVDLNNLSQNIYKTSMYNRNLRVCISVSYILSCMHQFDDLFLKQKKRG